MMIGEVAFYFSKPFTISRERLACIALIQIGDKVFSRLCYLSHSQATWRVMPAAEKWQEENYKQRLLGRYGKGIAETDTQLPIPIIIGLLDLIPQKINISYPEVSNLVRTAPDYTSTYLESVFIKDFCKLNPDAPDSFFKGGTIYHKTPDPTAIKLPEDVNRLPDFNSGLPVKEFQAEEYGLVKARVFPSKDKQMQYLFYEVPNGQVFLAAVEKVMGNPINSYGLRKETFETKGMDAPLREYKEQVPPGYEGEDYKKAQGIPPSWIKYISNWNFVRELEIIKLYYATQNLPVPNRV